jgi:hypothetical protein
LNKTFFFLATLSASSATGATSLGSEHKKSVTFDDGVKPGVETVTSAAAAVAATNIMSLHKPRTNEVDTDQVSSFKSGLVLKVFVNIE